MHDYLTDARVVKVDSLETLMDERLGDPSLQYNTKYFTIATETEVYVLVGRKAKTEILVDGIVEEVLTGKTEPVFYEELCLWQDVFGAENLISISDIPKDHTME